MEDFKDKNKDTVRDHTIIPTGSTLAVQREDGGFWKHDTHGTQDQNARSYTICMKKMGCIIMRTV